MKLLLDANISWRLVTVLKEYFDECLHVDNIPELEVPAKDSEIWQYAKNNNCIIITRDDDFSNLINMKGFPPKIVLLKTGNNSKKYTEDVLIRSKQEIYELQMSEEYGLLEIY
jgi:predicted nuclease of predicted toxin-antitoxin system